MKTKDELRLERKRELRHQKWVKHKSDRDWIVLKCNCGKECNVRRKFLYSNCSTFFEFLDDMSGTIIKVKCSKCKEKDII